MSTKGRSCGCKGQGSRKSRERFYNSEDFMVNSFKVLPCYKKYRHDWWVCPYAHEGETAKRRDPKKFKYVGVACPDAKQGKNCPRKDECPCTHNVFEYWLHPTRFRTAFCGRGIHCTRPFCFFAHSLSEMRKPSLDDLLPVIESDSLFNEEMLKAALEDHKRDVARLGGKDTCLELLDMSFLQVPRSNGHDDFKDLGSPVDPLQLGNDSPLNFSISPRDFNQCPESSPAAVSHGQFNSPIRDATSNTSPRDLSPVNLMNLQPNMQSPRGVLSFMNTILAGVDPNDLSPQRLHYGLGEAGSGHMISPRDWSPCGDHLSGIMRSPRGLSPSLPRGGSPGALPSPRGLSPHALQQMQSLDQESLVGALNALRDISPTGPHLQAMYGQGQDLDNMHSSHSPLNARPCPQGRVAGYGMAKRDISPQAGVLNSPGSRAFQHSASMHERGQYGGAFSGYHLEERTGQCVNPASPTLNGMDKGSIAAVRDMLNALEQSKGEMNGLSHLNLDNLGDGQTSMPFEHMAATLSVPVMDPDSTNSIPESVQAVLRSLAKEDSGPSDNDKGEISRPFSSLSQLW